MLENFISKRLVSFSILLFIFSALIGLLIRFNFAFPNQIGNYGGLVQGHSHVAFLGWGYLATIASIIHFFVPKDKLTTTYKISILIIVLSISLMLFSFPFSGYKAFSISLLAIFGITSYILSFKLLKNVNKTITSNKLIRFGIYYYLLSSLATWFLVYVIIKHGKTDLYYNTVYFYLHFLYNGFFVFSLFGLLFKVFEEQFISVSEKYKRLFFIYLNVACIPAYFLSVLWSGVGSGFYVIGFLASLLQLISLLFLLKIIHSVYFLLKWNAISKLLLLFLIGAYVLKIISQVFSSFPYFVDVSMLLKPYFIIGYLHLFTLAFMSVFLFLILNQLNKLSFKSLFSKIGVLLFLLGIVFTEGLLFAQGSLYLFKIEPLTHYNFLILFFSFFMLAGISIIFFTNFLKRIVLKK